MVVGVCTVELLIADPFSIKDRRRVVHSVTQRVRAKFNVAVAEVGELESWHVAAIAIVCVSNQRAHAESMLSKALRFLETERLDAEIGAVGISVEKW